ncbi:DUF6731 family protein [Sporosarcina sp. HYO08]|uniref:DUF6731 family protein n=1 Tax=Sporosarcina sp. HYO08 TaxID=1759557 RepID=UPI0007923D17|nr:DUF6731 family protein [Sporosarcina sp. HYO08]KXH86786.1 hypothetical protein AU377_14325 [Sporosarcina sp. HYO08]
MARAIRFDYFKVYARQYNQENNVMNEGICDLTNVLTQARAIPTRERVYRVGNDQARLQDIQQKNNKWEMHFVRIRKDGFPIKTNDDGTFGFFDDLSEDEGFGEEVSVLYDPNNCVIMIRRNMYSLSPSAIANYFTDVVNEPGFTVFFKPLVHPKAMELLKRDHLIRGAEVSIADIKNALPTTKKSLGQIISGANDMNESVGITFKISIQPKGSKKSSRLPVYEELEDMAGDPNVSKIEVRKKANEDAKVETVDLIQHRLYDFHNFSGNDISPKSRNILHITVVNRMQILYRTRINDINNTYV